MLIYENLKKISKEKPNKPSLIKDSEKISYQKLYQQVSTIAHKLATGTQLGDKIIIKLANPIKQIYYLLAAAKAGLAAVLVNSNKPQIEYKRLIDKINPKLIIDNNFNLSANENNNLPTVKASNIFLGALSSGSTGVPKVIWRDHKSWVSAFNSQSDIFNLSSKDKLLLVGPLIYTGNLNSAIHILYEGGTVVFAKSNFPDLWIKEILKYNISALFMVPAHYRILLKKIKEPLSQVNSLVSTGAKMDASTAKKLQNYFPKAQICEYYGASELGHVSYALADDIINKEGTVGRIFPGVTISLEDNLIWVKSPYLAVDYRPQATAKDLGEIKDGYLYLMGRKDNVINKGGTKINPLQVEKILLTHPKISEIAVIGIKDSLRGEIIATVIVRETPTLTKQNIRDFCQNNLSKSAHPQKILFLNKIPKNKTGKFDRNKIIQLFKNNTCL